MERILPAFFLLLLFFTSRSQTCDAPGQKPYNAFPVCGTNVFTQTTVPLCTGIPLPTPRCRNSGPITDRNAFWYKFTCFEAGTLGLKITPNDLTDDYDWELYDITGRDPGAIYTDGSLVVTSNWSGESGVTGAGPTGRTLFSCAGFGQPLFTSMAQLQKGHDYLLLISHFTETQSGYDLVFEGGTANITDTVTPHLKNAASACSGDVVRIKLNKKMKCSSIAADGSDFFVSGGVTVSGSAGIGCSNAFDTDSLEIKLTQPLAPGTYQLGVKQGSDVNTLLDYCDKPLAETEVATFIVYPIAPTPMDSMRQVTCSPQQIKLVFRNPISCASIATDGSDFSITGTYPVAMSSVSGGCNGNAATREITLVLASPLQQKGNFVLTLQKGSDGNTLLDECTQETPAGSSLSFSVKDTVNADFAYSVNYGCTIDVVSFIHDGDNEVNSWEWNLDNNISSTVQNPQAEYTDFRQKDISLLVSNGFCSDSAKQSIVLDNFLEVDFAAVPDNCPLEPVAFTGLAEGKIISHSWLFGDGGSSDEESPGYIYRQPLRETDFQVRYTVTDTYGCQKMITKPLKIYSSCTVYVPNAFTPNGDGMNDVFRIQNGVKTESFNLKIFNRWGQPVFETKNWKQGWDGRYGGQLQATGTFVWFMRYTDIRTNKPVERKGSLTLIR